MTAEPDGHMFLPDFVGYPICFFGLRALLPATIPATYIDYSRYWPYASIDELARVICADIRPQEVGVVIGYSFGAYVAIEVAAILAADGMAPRLLLIDPPMLAEVAALAARDVEDILRKRPDYEYIFDLVDCELARVDCMLGNIAFLGRVSAPVTLPVPCTMLVAGDRAPIEGFVCEAGLVDVHYLADCDHRSILGHHATIEKITSATAKRR